MRDATKQDFNPEDAASNDIAADDPLFELSRIIGFGDAPVPQAPDPQIDLEEALMAEMALEPAAEDFAALDEPLDDDLLEADSDALDQFLEPHVEPTVDAELVTKAQSLEEELAAMLGGDVTVATQVPEPSDFAAPVQPEVDALGEFDETLDIIDEDQPAASFDDFDNDVELEETESSDEPVDAQLENNSEDLQFQNVNFEDQDAAISSAEANTEISDDDDIELDAELEDDFSAFFNDEMPDTDSDFENDFALDAQEADAMPVHDPVNDLPAADAKFDEALAALDSEAPIAPNLQKDMPAPSFETTDMSGFHDDVISQINVPDLPDVDSEFAAIFEGELETSANDDPFDSNFIAPDAAAGAALAGAGGAIASTLSKRAGQNAMNNDDITFDESRFEAELARDMEFATHDLDVSFEPEELTLEDGFENQDFAIAAGENRPAKRGLVIAAILGCLAIAGAIGVFAFSGTQTAGTDGPVLVEAGTDPVKVAPENPGGKEVPNQDRAVFNETGSALEQAALNSTAEEPVDIAAVPDSGLPSGLNDAEAQKGEDRLIPADSSDAGTADNSNGLVAPRRVRTLVVRPDGTLVERAEVPTPEPVVPPSAEVAAAVVEPAPETVELQEVAVDATSAAAPVVEEVAQTAPPVVNTIPTRTVRTQPILAPENIVERPADQPVNIVNPEPVQVAAAQTTQPEAAPTPEAASTPFAVQLASLPTQADAQTSATNISRRFGNVLGGRGVSIQSAVIDGRGTFYRVRVGANSRDDANELCGRIKSAGGDCFVTR